MLKVVIDAPRGLHDQELAFWQGALGQELPGTYSAEYYGAALRGPGANDSARSAYRRREPGGSDHDR